VFVNIGNLLCALDIVMIIHVKSIPVQRHVQEKTDDVQVLFVIYRVNVHALHRIS